jgi:hypothetical protein
VPVITFTMTQGAISAAKTTVKLNGEQKVQAGANIEIQITPKDAYDNVITLTDELFAQAAFTYTCGV